MARGSGAVYARRGGGDKNENRDGMDYDEIYLNHPRVFVSARRVSRIMGLCELCMKIYIDL